MSYRDFHLLGKTELNRIAEGATAAVQRWSETWLAGRPQNPVVQASALNSPAQLGQAVDASWQGVLVDHYSVVEFCHAGDMTRYLLTSESSENTVTSASGIVGKMTVELTTELIKIIVKEFNPTVASFAHIGDSCTLPVAANSPGNAMILIEINFTPGVSSKLLIEHTLLKGVAPEPRPVGNLTAAHSAIGNNQLHLNVQLGKTDLNIETLMALGVGDVLKLDKPIDEELEVMANGKVICKGYVGKSADRYAIRVSTKSV
jgi:flagellar motor switch/type III secretory pathway protein FliN